jgi:dynein heavy chain
MPKLDPYDTQSAIALIRQSIDYNHWYDREKVELKTISNTMYISAMNPTAGSFYVNPRLMRHFFTLLIQLPDNKSLIKIYKTFVSNHFKNFNKTVSDEASDNLCKSALFLHQEVCLKFRKTAANFHYEFNIRHLTGVFQGVLQARPD